MPYSVAEREKKTQKAIELYAKQHSFRAIGEELCASHNTIKKWIEDEFARRAEHRGLDKEAHLAVYDAIQKAAWEAFENTNERSLNRSGYLNTIKAAEDSKTRITGAEAPKKFQDVSEEPYLITFDDDEVPTETAS